jgi:DNA repair protein RecO
MTRVVAVWDEKNGRDLHRLDQVEGCHSYARMQAEPLCQAVCAVFSELTEAFGREGGSDDREFRLLAAVLDALEAGIPLLVALRYFEFWTLRLHGMIADLRRCAHCDSEMPSPGSRLIGIHDGARCSNCQTHAADPGRTLSTRDCAWLDRLHRDKPLDLKTMDPAARVGGELARLFHAQLESFAERKFRSYRHVHALALTTEASS